MGFFEKIREGLKKTKESIGASLNGLVASFRRVDEDFLDELLELLRQSGTVDLQQIWQASLETNGQVSVLLRAEHMPASAKDAGIQVKQIAVPVSIISDGRVLQRNLEALGHDRAWLDEQLRQRSLRAKDVFLFTQEPGGKQYWLPREGLK